MQVKLKVLTGSHSGKEIAVSSDKFLIGRSDSCQLRPKSESVSRKHCILVVQESRVLIQDLKSRNGTYVNQKRLPIGKAKVLQPGDHLKIGKLEFEILIEHGLQAPKKPEVQSIGDAAARTVEAGMHDSRFEEVDVTSWLDEADQIDRVRKVSDPETRQMKLGASAEETLSRDDDSSELSVGGSDTDGGAEPKSKDRKIPTKQKPGKLPEGMKKAMKENSRDAADDALKRFFSGR